MTIRTKDDCSLSPKRAVYKAVYPLDQRFLDHHDVQINFADRKAVVRNGRVRRNCDLVSRHTCLRRWAFFCLGCGERVPLTGASRRDALRHARSFRLSLSAPKVTVRETHVSISDRPERPKGARALVGSRKTKCSN